MALVAEHIVVLQKRKQSGADDVGSHETLAVPASTSASGAADSDANASVVIATPVQMTRTPAASRTISDCGDGTAGTVNDDSDTPSATQLIPVRVFSSVPGMLIIMRLSTAHMLGETMPAKAPPRCYG